MDSLKRSLTQVIEPADTAVLITAAPVDRRRSFPKWCEKNADFTLIGGGEGDGEALEGVILAEANAVGAKLSPDAVRLLVKTLAQEGDCRLCGLGAFQKPVVTRIVRNRQWRRICVAMSTLVTLAPKGA